MKYFASQFSSSFFPSPHSPSPPYKLFSFMFSHFSIFLFSAHFPHLMFYFPCPHSRSHPLPPCVWFSSTFASSLFILLFLFVVLNFSIVLLLLFLFVLPVTSSVLVLDYVQVSWTPWMMKSFQKWLQCSSCPTSCGHLWRKVLWHMPVLLSSPSTILLASSSWNGFMY